jgi:hypothetical protein
MQVDFGFIYYKERRFGGSGDVSQQLTPNLKAKTGPKLFPGNSVFRAKHSDSFATIVWSFWRINLHSGPGIPNEGGEMFKTIWEIVPVVTEVPRSSMS